MAEELGQEGKEATFNNAPDLQDSVQNLPPIPEQAQRAADREGGWDNQDFKRNNMDPSDPNNYGPDGGQRFSRDKAEEIARDPYIKIDEETHAWTVADTARAEAAVEESAAEHPKGWASADTIIDRRDAHLFEAQRRGIRDRAVERASKAYDKQQEQEATPEDLAA